MTKLKKKERVTRIPVFSPQEIIDFIRKYAVLGTSPLKVSIGGLYKTTGLSRKVCSVIVEAIRADDTLTLEVGASVLKVLPHQYLRTLSGIDEIGTDQTAASFVDLEQKKLFRTKIEEALKAFRTVNPDLRISMHERYMVSSLAEAMSWDEIIEAIKIATTDDFWSHFIKRPFDLFRRSKESKQRRIETIVLQLRARKVKADQFDKLSM
jgi:hypothetical protein